MLKWGLVKKRHIIARFRPIYDVRECPEAEGIVEREEVMHMYTHICYVPLHACLSL